MIHDWRCQEFSKLEPAALYSILRLRQEVFVVEQDCAFLDADGLDQCAWHVTGWRQQSLLAYARVFAPGLVREEASIGRVLCALAVRRQGLGFALMNQVIEQLPQLIGNVPVWIGAQERLCPFYAQFGFAETGERYLEDGIWHRGMHAQQQALRPVKEPKI